MQLVYGVVLGEPARRRLFPEGAVGILGELPAEIDVEGAYGLVDVPGNAVVGCGVINGGRGGKPLPLEKLERQLQAEIKNAKRRWKGLAAWVEEKSKGKIKLGKPGLVLVLED